MSGANKRSLSESSTGSEDTGDDNLRHHGIMASFKKPRMATSNSLAARTSPPLYERRESQASTASSASISVSEDDEYEANQLNEALDSNSEETDEDSTGRNGFEGTELSAASVAGGDATGPANTSGSQYSSFAQKMMAKMGYKGGQGLGKAGQGIVEPVTASRQRGRRGLGLIIEGLEEENVVWDASKEFMEVVETVDWLPQNNQHPLAFEEMKGWMQVGVRKETVDDENLFVDQDVLSGILKCKDVFDRLEPEEMRKARTRSNPFETIHGAFFLNRAAMKMANMDGVFDFMFTDPKDEQGRPLMGGHNSLLYFADVCAGPGGFSEYVLWKKKWRAKGFGFTLKCQNDFKLDDFYAGTPESFETHYGAGGRDGDGDVFKEENILAFKKFVLENTEGQGVHFMMADGGFSVEGQENIQEILSKQLYLCQFLVALCIVRSGGHFVCKLFDLFTPFSVGLIYLMRRAFDQVCIHKPNTSRPANSERYIICKGKRPDCGDIEDYFFAINRQLNHFGLTQLGRATCDQDLIKIVPMAVMQNDPDFWEYMRQSNNILGERQIIALAKIKAYCKDQNLMEPRQKEIREECLKFWRIPNQVRRAPPHELPQHKIGELFGHQSVDFLTSQASDLTFNVSKLNESIHSIYDWKCVAIGAAKESMHSERSFFMGMGRAKVYQLNSLGNRWDRVQDGLKFDLPAMTLIYAEVVKEFRGEGRSMRRSVAVHIIDAAFLGGEDLRKLDFKMRNEILRVFVKSMAKPSRPEYVALRVKDIIGLEHIDKIFHQLHPRVLKGGSSRPRLTIEVDHEMLPSEDGHGRPVARYYCPTGLLMFRIVKHPFMIAYSAKNNRKYWFNTQTKASQYEIPQSAGVDFKTAFEQRLIWHWEEGVQLKFGMNDGQLVDQEFMPRDSKKLQADMMIDFVRSRKPS